MQTGKDSEGLHIEEGQETVTLESRTPSLMIKDQEHQVKKEKPGIHSFTSPAMLRKESTKVETYRHKIIKQAFRFGQYAVAVSYLYCFVKFLREMDIHSEIKSTIRETYSASQW